MSGYCQHVTNPPRSMKREEFLGELRNWQFLNECSMHPVRMWNGFVWLRILITDGFLRTLTSTALETAHESHSIKSFPSIFTHHFPPSNTLTVRRLLTLSPFPADSTFSLPVSYRYSTFPCHFSLQANRTKQLDKQKIKREKERETL